MFLHDCTGGLIVENRAGDKRDSAFFGQSVTIPAGANHINIKFNFESEPSTPYAAGLLSVLTAEHTGTPAELQGSPHLIATTDSVVNSQWVFDSLTLKAGTQYWFYLTEAPLESLAISYNNPYPRGRISRTASPTDEFSDDWDEDLNFQLYGEPSVLRALNVVGGEGLGRGVVDGGGSPPPPQMPACAGANRVQPKKKVTCLVEMPGIGYGVHASLSLAGFVMFCQDSCPECFG